MSFIRHHHRRLRHHCHVLRVDCCSAPWPPAISDLHKTAVARALASSWTLLSQTLRGRGPLISSWPLAFCLRNNQPSDAEHHVLVLQGPGVQHDQTEISVDDVKCHQWLTNQIDKAPLHWRHESTSMHQVSVADTSCGKHPVYSCRRPRGST